jgi:uncharacterized membrane protein (UPF0127 family)
MEVLCRLSYSGRSGHDSEGVGSIDVRASAPGLLALVLALAAVGCSDPTASGDGTNARAQVVIASGDRTVTVDVEVADDEFERRIGLMGRTDLAADAGMAFLFPEPTSGSFWMKDTLIPLSIAFWDEDGSIVAILDMHPCPDDECPSYDPGVDFVGALEVNQGFFDEHGIEIGDRVRLEGVSG